MQSYDGQLSLFEQERFAFARFLPNFLVPGPLCYCAQLDSFVTCNAAFEVESCRWGLLSSWCRLLVEVLVLVVLATLQLVRTMLPEVAC